MPTIHDYRKKPHWSFSSLNTYLNICSLFWAFRYIYRLEPEHTSVNLVFGKAFHAAASYLAINRMKNRATDETGLADYFSESWNLECKITENIAFSNSSEWDSLNSIGRAMTKCLGREWLEDGIIAVSEAFSVPLCGYDGVMVSEKALIGEWDLVIKDKDKKTVIVDWKTAVRKWPDGKAGKDLQATCFLYGYSRRDGVLRDIPGLRYDVITKTVKPAYTMIPTARSHNDFQRLLKLVETVERGIKAEVYYPGEQSFYCNDCAYAGACREWHRESRKTVSTAA